MRHTLFVASAALGLALTATQAGAATNPTTTAPKGAASAAVASYGRMPVAVGVVAGPGALPGIDGPYTICPRLASNYCVVASGRGSVHSGIGVSLTRNATTIKRRGQWAMVVQETVGYDTIGGVPRQWITANLGQPMVWFPTYGNQNICLGMPPVPSAPPYHAQISICGRVIWVIGKQGQLFPFVYSTKTSGPDSGGNPGLITAKPDNGSLLTLSPGAVRGTVDQWSQMLHL